MITIPSMPNLSEANEMSRPRIVATWTRDRALAARVEAITTAIEKATGLTFAAHVAPHVNNLDAGLKVSIVNVGGATITLNAEHDGKIHVSGSYPTQRDGSIGYLRSADHIKSINVTASKSDEAIGREIARRFWPGYRAIFESLAERYRSAGNYADQTAECVKRFVAQTGARIGHNDREALNIKTEITVYCAQKGVHSASISGDSVSFDRMTIPVDVAIAFLKLLPKSE